MLEHWPLLSILIWTPIIGGVGILCCDKVGYKNAIKPASITVTVICLLFCYPLCEYFQVQSWEMQWLEKVVWLPSLDINYSLGIDGLSLPLVILTCLITPLVIIMVWQTTQKHLGEYLAAFLIMQGLMCGVFLATDAILFYVFWEATLIPMFLIIGIWGGNNRVYASLKFFIYTFLGSIFLLAALIYMHSMAVEDSSLSSNFAIQTFYNLKIDLATQKILFLGLFVGFAVKIPMWPVHTWLPDAHVEAPTGGSAVLAAIMLKMGGYGFLRFLLPIVPEACFAWSDYIIALSLIAITYIGFIAIIQNDMKKLIAYSSISHMGIVTLGIFIIFKLLAIAPTSVEVKLALHGAMVQMISHGLISAGLFFCVGVLYSRMHTKLIKDYGGVTQTMPCFAALFMLFAMANIGLPATSGFVGEFLVILASFKASIWYAAIAATTLILGAGYTLWMFKRVMFGKIKNQNVKLLTDLYKTEVFGLGILGCLVLLLGIWPAPLIKVVDAPLQNLITHIMQSKLI